jgi:D-tyrosyl-tRNA(Tyr) deacylase
LKIVIQRVSSSVTIENKTVADIKRLINLRVETADLQEDIDWLVGKITKSVF